MEELRYRVIFQGEIAPGAVLAEVKKNLSALFEVDIDEIHQLFSGKPFVLKENVSKEEAQEFTAQIEKTGAHCKRVRMTEIQTAQAREAKTPAAADSKKTDIDERITAAHYEARYRLMFSGEIAVDKDLNEVKTNLSMFYMVKPERLEGLFIGQPVPIKDKMDFWAAVAYLNRFKQCGAVAYLESQEAPGTVEEDVDKYKIVFCRELRADQDLLTVKTALSSLFKVPGVVVDKLFLAEPVLVRTNLSAEEAESFKRDFEKTGALCQVLSVPGKPLLLKPKDTGVKHPPTAAPAIPPKQPAKQPVERSVKQRVEQPSVHRPASPQPPPKAKAQEKPSTPAATIKQQFIASQADQPAQPVTPTQPRKPRRSTQPLKPRERNNTVIIFGIAAVLIVIFVIFKMLSTPDNRETESTPVKQETAAAPSRQPTSEPQAATTTPPPVKRGLLPDDTEIFQDSNNYFTVYLPTGSTVSDKSSAQQSKVTFDYTLNANVSITATPRKGEWDPEEALKQKMDAIQTGKEKQLSRFQVETFGLVSFNDLSGYEIILKEKKLMVHVYALISSNKIFYTVAISTGGGAMQENHDILASAIRDNLSL